MSVSKTAIVAAIVIALAFVAGFAAGVVADRLLIIRRPPPPPHPLAVHAMAGRLDHHLDLTDDQRAKIEQIIQRRHRSIGAEIAEANAEIERVLTPEQRRKFAKMRMRLGHREGRGRREPTR